MIYSRDDIEQAIKDNTISIVPYTSDQLGANSYDVRLGNYFYELFWDQDGPFYVGPYYVEDGHRVYVPVGGTLLAMTKEKIVITGPIVPELRTRSSIRRIGIDVCMAAGFGDIGYSDHWTMELTAFVSNGWFYEILKQFKQLLNSWNIAIVPLTQLLEQKQPRPFLLAGERLAQIVFYRATSMPSQVYQGQYKTKWPKNMVPKQYRHRIVEARKTND